MNNEKESTFTTIFMIISSIIIVVISLTLVVVSYCQLSKPNAKAIEEEKRCLTYEQGSIETETKYCLKLGELKLLDVEGASI